MCRLLNCKVNWEDIVRPLQKIGTTAVVCVSVKISGCAPKTTAKEWQQPATLSAVTNTSFILNPYRASIVELEHPLMIAWGSVCRCLCCCCCVLFGILGVLNVLVLHLCRSYGLVYIEGMCFHLIASPEWVFPFILYTFFWRYPPSSLYLCTNPTDSQVLCILSFSSLTC